MTTPISHIANHVAPGLASAANKAGIVATGAVVGAAIGSALLPIAGGLIGGVAGGYVAYKALPIIAGAGNVSSGIKGVAQKAAQVVKKIALFPFTLLKFLLYPLYKATLYLANAAATSAYRRADKIYEKNSDLQALAKHPIEGGVAKQAHIIGALAASTPDVDPQQIEEFVAIGEHLMKALQSDSPLQEVGDKEALGVKVDIGGKAVPIQSSAYTTRAIAWYLSAQKLWHDDVSSTAEAGSQQSPSEAAARMLDKPVFVFNDPHHRVARFVKMGKNSDLTQADVLTQQQFSARNIGVAVVDDSRYLLPGAAGRAVAVPLKPEDGVARTALQLQPHARPGWMGQHAAGHEGLDWQIAQVVSGITTNLDIVLADSTPAVTHSAPAKAGQQAANQVIDEIFAGVGNLTEDEQRMIAGMKQLPLVSVLRLMDQRNPLSRDFPSDVALGAQLTDKTPLAPLVAPTPNQEKDAQQVEREIGAKLREGIPQLLGKLNNETYAQLRGAIVAGMRADGTGDWLAEKGRQGGEIFVPVQPKSAEEMQRQIASDRTNREKGISDLEGNARRNSEAATNVISAVGSAVGTAAPAVAAAVSGAFNDAVDKAGALARGAAGAAGAVGDRLLGMARGAVNIVLGQGAAADGQKARVNLGVTNANAFEEEEEPNAAEPAPPSQPNSTTSAAVSTVDPSATAILDLTSEERQELTRRLGQIMRDGTFREEYGNINEDNMGKATRAIVEDILSERADEDDEFFDAAEDEAQLNAIQQDRAATASDGDE